MQKNQKLKRLCAKSTVYLKRASPTILTCIAAVGVVATSVMTAKATPKAIALVRSDSRKNHDGDPYACTKLEAVQSAWRCYVPAFAVGASTVVCIFGANVLSRKQQLSLAGTYALVSHSYSDYKRKLKELYGEEPHEKIMESLAVEKANDTHIVSCGIVSNSSLEFNDADEKQRLFYDSFSQRYFQSTISQVLQAEYHLNRNFALMGGFVPLNMFYEFLGIEPLQDFSDFGWYVDDNLLWIDFNHSKAMVDDGLNGEYECYIVDMDWVPTDKEPD